MAGYPPPYPPPPGGYDPRTQRRVQRDQEKYQRRMQKDAYQAQRDAYRAQTRGLYRPSISGPLMLIGVGICFLLVETGRINQARAFDWFASWWPAVILGAGVILLIEWAVDQFLQPAEGPHYRRAVGGLPYFIIFFVVICGIIASAGRGHKDFFTNGFHIGSDNLDEFLGDKHDSDQIVDLSLPKDGMLSVTNPRGDVTISGTSDDNQIHVAVHKQIYASSDSDADSKAQRFTPQIDKGSTTAITMPTIDGARADLILTVPGGAPLTVTANHGDMHISSIKASVMASANHGDIELSGITGPVTAHVNSSGASITAHSLGNGLTIEGHAGDVTIGDATGPVSIHGEFFGTTHLQHIAGSVRFHTSRTDFQLARLDGEVEISPNSELTADHALGPVTLTTRNRNITLDRIAGDVSVTNSNGTIDLTAAPNTGGQMGDITLQDRNGQITTIVPEHAGFTLQAGTTNGDIDTEFQLLTGEHGSSRSATGTVGNGGPHLSINTTNANINLRKSAIDPLAPTPPAGPKLTLVPAKPPALQSAAPPVAPRPPAAPRTPIAPRAPKVEPPPQ
jgi:DUF4097 and DUF4098 domain-containing protein YvlB